MDGRRARGSWIAGPFSGSPLLIGLLVVATLAAGCSPSEGEGASSAIVTGAADDIIGTQPTAPTTTTAVPGASTTSGSVDAEGPGGTWAETAPPPSGVRAQLRYFVGGGGGPCPPHDEIRLPDPPYIVDPFGESDVEIGHAIVGCIAGFTPGSDVAVAVREPTGAETRRTESDVQEYTQIYRFVPAGSPLGRYAVEVAGAGTEATMEVTVVEATMPRIAADLGPINLAWRERGPATFTFAGFPPGEAVEVYLYGLRFGEQWPESGGNERTFIAELEPLLLDARGEGLYNVTIPTDAPTGAYCLVTASIVEGIPELESGDPCWGGGGLTILLD